MSTCNSCDAEIEWAVTEKGKFIPLDTDPVADGNITVESKVATPRGMQPLAKYVGKGTGDRVSHFATCPQSASHRR